MPVVLRLSGRDDEASWSIPYPILEMGWARCFLSRWRKEGKEDVSCSVAVLRTRQFRSAARMAESDVGREAY